MYKSKWAVLLLICLTALAWTTGCSVPNNDEIQKASWLRRVLTRSLGFTWNSHIGDPFGISYFDEMFNDGNPSPDLIKELEDKTSGLPNLIPQELSAKTGWRRYLLKAGSLKNHNEIKECQVDYVDGKLIQLKLTYRHPEEENAVKMIEMLNEHFALIQEECYIVNNPEKLATNDNKSTPARRVLEFRGKPNFDSWAELSWKGAIDNKLPETQFTWRGHLPQVPPKLQEELTLKAIEYLVEKKEVRLVKDAPIEGAIFTFNGYRLGKPNSVHIVFLLKTRDSDDRTVRQAWGVRADLADSGSSSIADAIQLQDDEKSYERASLRDRGDWTKLRLSFCEPPVKKSEPAAKDDASSKKSKKTRKTAKSKKEEKLLQFHVSFGDKYSKVDSTHRIVKKETVNERMNFKVIEIEPQNENVAKEQIWFMNSNTVNGIEIFLNSYGMTLDEAAERIVFENHIDRDQCYSIWEKDTGNLTVLFIRDFPEEGCIATICNSPVNSSQMIFRVRKGLPEVPQDVQNEVYNAVVSTLSDRIEHTNIHKPGEGDTEFRFSWPGVSSLLYGGQPSLGILDPNSVEGRIEIANHGKYQYWGVRIDYDENGDMIEPDFDSTLYEAGHLIPLQKNEKSFFRGLTRSTSTEEELRNPNFQMVLECLDQ